MENTRATSVGCSGIDFGELYPQRIEPLGMVWGRAGTRVFGRENTARASDEARECTVTEIEPARMERGCDNSSRSSRTA